MTGGSDTSDERIYVADGQTHESGLWGKLTRMLVDADRRPTTTFIKIYIISLIISLIFGYIFRFRYELSHLEADEIEYYNIATELINGVWQISPRRTVGFPLMIAGGRSIGLSLLGLQVMLTAINAFAAPLLYLIVKKLTRLPGLGILTALAFAIWPSALFYGTSFYSETAALPVFLLAICLVPAGSRLTSKPSPWTIALLAGAVLGIAAHIRPMYQLYLPILLIVVFVEERSISTAFKRFLILVAGFSLVVLPWSAYMSARFDRTIILTSNGGETLSGGLTPKLLEPGGITTTAGGNRTTWVGPGKWVAIEQNGYLSAKELGLPYDQLDGLLRERAIEWITKNPAKALQLETYKLAYMWGLYSPAPNSLPQTLFGSIPVAILFFFSIACVLFRARDRVQLVRLWTLALFVSGIALISWGSWRFRQPADAGLLAFSIICLAHMIASRFGAGNGENGPLR